MSDVYKELYEKEKKEKEALLVENAELKKDLAEREKSLLILRVRSRIEELEKNFLPPSALNDSRYEKWRKIMRNCNWKVEKITTNEGDENVQIFKEKMDKFLQEGKKMFDEELENLEESKKKFIAVLNFYDFQSKRLSCEEPNPKDFFMLWFPFCSDFKALWRIEQQNLMKEKLKETRQKEKERRSTIQKFKKRESGLKASMRNIGSNLEDDE